MTAQVLSRSAEKDCLLNHPFLLILFLECSHLRTVGQSSPMQLVNATVATISHAKCYCMGSIKNLESNPVSLIHECSCCTCLQDYSGRFGAPGGCKVNDQVEI